MTPESVPLDTALDYVTSKAESHISNRWGVGGKLNLREAVRTSGDQGLGTGIGEFSQGTSNRGRTHEQCGPQWKPGGNWQVPETLGAGALQYAYGLEEITQEEDRTREEKKTQERSHRNTNISGIREKVSESKPGWKGSISHQLNFAKICWIPLGITPKYSQSTA